MLKLLPSVLSADFANLGRDLACIKEAGITQVHVDVMDGNFVPSISLGFPVGGTGPLSGGDKGCRSGQNRCSCGSLPSSAQNVAADQGAGL